MNHHLATALTLYESNNADFAELLKWHLAYGVVVSLPDCFMFGYFCDRNKPTQPKILEESDCVFITLCVGNMRQAGLQIVELVPWIAYEREFKGDNRIRITNFKKFFNKI
jgi:hypothetical protein